MLDLECHRGRRRSDVAGRSHRIGLLLACIASLLLPAVAAAQEVSDPDRVEQAPIPRAFGASGSVQIAPGVGSVTDSLPLSLPRSRRAFEPKLSFDYSSGAGQGDLGRGWSLHGFGYIEVYTGDGVPIEDPAAPLPLRFAYRYGGDGGELVQVGDPSEGRYRALTENAYLDFRRIDEGAAGVRWEVRSGDGVVRSFGASGASRIGERRWLLDQERDASGNTIAYSYVAFDRQGQSCSSFVLQRCAAYPRAVRYGAHPQFPMWTNRVDFEYEMRPDLRLSMRLGVPQERAMRLSRVSVFTGPCGNVETCPQLVRRYELAYVQRALNEESLLERITLVGADDASRVVLRSLEYGTRPVGWGELDTDPALPEAMDFVDAMWRNRGTRLADVNGDGYQDAIARFDDASLPSVFLGSDAGFAYDPGWSSSFGRIGVDLAVKSGSFYGADSGVRILDVDGDGRADVVVANGSRTEVWLNTGFAQVAFPVCGLCGWERSDLWSNALASLSVSLVINDPFAAAGQDNGIRFADVDGDGQIDVIRAVRKVTNLVFPPFPPSTQTEDIRDVYLNTGAGWERSDVLSSSLPFAFVVQNFTQFVFAGATPVGWELLEVNGDGLVDLVNTAERSPGNPPQVYLGSPDGWFFDPERSDSLLAHPLIESKRARRGTGLMSLDYNGDGLVDFMRGCFGNYCGLDPIPQNQFAGVHEAWRNTGTGWVADPVMSQVMDEQGISFIIDRSFTGEQPDLQFGIEPHDVNGDGTTDWLLATRLNPPTRVVRRAEYRPEAGLLVRSTNALGEVTEIAWESSSRFDNRQRDPGTGNPVSPVVHQLPVVLPVATRLTRHDGRGNAYATECDYLGGAFLDGEYRGFARSTKTEPNGLRRETDHAQEEELVGRPLVTRAFDTLDRLRARTTVSYELRAAEGGLVTQVALTGTEQEAFDELGTTTQHQRVQNDYDDRLNPLSSFRDPDLEVPGRETLTEYSWLRDDTVGIWSLPNDIRIDSADGSLFSHTRFTYDELPPGQVSRGLPSLREDWVEGAEYLRQEFQYDGLGNLTTLVDRNGETHEFEYGDPAATYRTRGVDPEGRVVTSEYDPRFGVVTRDVNASGDEQRNEYDAFGRLARVFLPGDDPGFPSTAYQYSPVGADAGVPCAGPTISPCVEQSFVVEERERIGEAATFARKSFFDARGLIHRVETDGSAGRLVVVEREFDDVGNVTGETLPFYDGTTPSWRRTERDELRRPTRLEDPDGLATTFRYVGKRVDVEDRRGVLSSYTRDGSGNIVEINRPVDGIDQITLYRYDEANRIVEVVDALGSQTLVGYDGFGRRIQLEDSNLGVFLYEYDGEGNLLSQTVPSGDVTRFAHDTVGELVRKTFPDGTQQIFEYGAPGGEPHAVGRLVRVTDAAGTLTQRYDARGNVVEKRRDLSTRRRPGKTYVTGFAYDAIGRVTRVTYPDGYTADYQYDEGGALDQVTDSAGRTLARGMERNAAGQLLAVRYGNGLESSFAYDVLNRTASISTWDRVGVDLQALGFDYDDGHNIVAIDDFAHGDSQAFDYDDAGRLVRATGSYGQADYVYDAAGGLLQNGPMAFATDPARPQRVTCAVETAIDPTGANCAQLAAAGMPGATAIGYDARGNVVEKGDRRYGYDSENRLLTVRDASGSLLQANVYDAFGQRVIERRGSVQTVFIEGLYEEGPVSTARHVRGEGRLLATVVAPRAGIQLIAEVPAAQGSNGGAAGLAGIAGLVAMAAGTRRPRWRRRRDELRALAGKVRRKPGRAGTSLLLVPLYLLAAWQPLLLGCVPETFGEAYYYHTNHLGSVEVITDERGREVERRAYRPYGERNAWSGAEVGNEELLASFGGHRFDRAADLYYMGARHYDAELGRFLSADVIVPNPADPRTLHRYAFAGGNPIRLADPTGRYFWDDIVAAVVYVWDAAILPAANATFDAFDAVGDFFQENTDALIAVAIIAALIAVAIFVPALAPGILIGMAVGATSATLEHFASGGSADSLLGPLLMGAAVGGVLGLATGGTAAAGRSASSSLARNGFKYLARGAAAGAKGVKLLGRANQLRKIATPTVALISMATARERFVRPGFGAVPSFRSQELRGTGDTPFGLGRLEFLVPGFQPDDVSVGRFNGLATYPLAP